MIYKQPKCFSKHLLQTNLHPQTPLMYNSLLRYKLTGIHRLSGFKEQFNPEYDINRTALNDFVNLFCEYQLADNNYQNIHLEAIEKGNDKNWYNRLNIDQALRLLTYIIWTDKLSSGYLMIKVKDQTIYRILNRLEMIVAGSVLAVAGD
jgi:hypothetical protein